MDDQDDKEKTGGDGGSELRPNENLSVDDQGAKEKTGGDGGGDLRPDKNQILVSGQDGKYLMEKSKWPNLKEPVKNTDGVKKTDGVADVLLGWETHGYKRPEGTIF